MCRPRLPFTAIRARTTSFILNLDDEVTRSLKASGNLFCTSKAGAGQRVFLKDDVIYIADGGVRRELMPASDISSARTTCHNMMMAAAVVRVMPLTTISAL